MTTPSRWRRCFSNGQYDWKNSLINSRNFPVRGEGVVEVKLELVHLSKVANTSDVEAYLEENGLRAATLKELLAFGAKYPKIQREFPVVARGSPWVDPFGRRSVPCLVTGGSERILGLVWLDDGWSEDSRFLAVRK